MPSRHGGIEKNWGYPQHTVDSPFSFFKKRNCPLANFLEVGDKIFKVNDRMHPRYGAGRVDLWLDAPVEKVKEFGVKRVRMEIY